MIALARQSLSLPRCSARASEGSDEGWLVFQERVARYTSRYAGLWEAAEAAAPCLGPAIPLSDKLRREAEANRQSDDFKRRLKALSRSQGKRDARCEALLDAIRETARMSGGFSDAGLRLFFNRDCLDITRRFVREARAFDAQIKDESLFQALRNVWVVNCIQLLLERRISLSPAILGYSLLYPWTDNYLDEPGVPGKSKFEFGGWLEQRLRGLRTTTPDERALQVGKLVALIEGHFPRAEFEEVYLSLRAIHEAQMVSLQQQGTGKLLSERELLLTTVRKGGTSVLADAYLEAGQLDEAAAEFMFGFGVLLQLMDDLQDLPADLANGHATLFTRQAENSLDGVTSRLWSFALAVLRFSDAFEAQRFEAVVTLIQETCKLSLLHAVARNHGLYTSGFVSQMEASSPFTFNFLRDREIKLEAEFRGVIDRLRERRGIESGFELFV